MRLEIPHIEPTLPVSIENARVLIVKALVLGRMHVTEHFKERGRERGFTTVDAEKIVRDGAIVGKPSYCPRFENWRFKLTGISCSRKLEICVGLSLELDLDAPVLALITGIPKGRTKSCLIKKPEKTLRL
jgi:hypothetical protein